MNKEKVINILKSFEYFVDDDYGGHYENIDCSQRACTPLGILKILDYIDDLNKALNEIKEYINGFEHLEDWKSIDGYVKREKNILQIIDKVLGEEE